MLTGKRSEWYSNQQIFEMLQQANKELAATRSELKDDLLETRAELRATKEAVKKYNSLHAKLAEVCGQVATHEILLKQQDSYGQGKKSVEAAILRWAPLIVAIISIIIGAFLK